MKTILTGSNGFIGWAVRLKLEDPCELYTIDSFEQQVHGDGPKRPRCGEFKSLPSSDVVIHLAALVGVGQSMYEPARYVECNTLDTARFLENITKNKPKRLVVASSMSIYGEGATEYEVAKDKTDDRYVWGTGRKIPAATNESKAPELRSVYALTKYDQEQLCLMWGEANGVDVIALRFFNTWGPGQALSNPYTGVLTTFACRLLHGKAPIVFEDGQQTRDFIHVDDVSNAVVHAALGKVPRGTFNVGTGIPRTIESVARDLAEVMTADLPPVITGRIRAGDIRHCYADNTKLRSTGWEPKKDWREGLREYVDWLRKQPLPEDRTDLAIAELEAKGLLK